MTNPKGEVVICAKIIREAFNLVATGDFSVEHVFRSMREKGLRMSKANFWRMLRSRHYIGKIFVAAFKDEDAHYVEGQNDGIIAIPTFLKVQDVLDCIILVLLRDIPRFLLRSEKRVVFKVDSKSCKFTDLQDFDFP
ncbi:recombinase family protein [Algoriphagus resistens]|uniref:recombinase family protein n=1 Tax=Algoriphagus resistens TaxID=1750590 RepID=UPI0012F9B184|nr:recombinase family protein [Algoriphagus resistens]